MDLTGYIPMVTTTGGANPKVKDTSFVHWTQASRQGPPGHNEWMPLENVEVPQETVEQMRASLPVVVRRSPKERYRAVLQRISADVIDCYRRTGRVHWPASAERELREIAWRTGDPTLTDLGGIEQVQRQVEALTLQIMQTNERSQSLQDSKKSTLDWAGH